MKVLLITHGEFLNMERVVSGNSVRSYYLERGLAETGVAVVHAYPAGLGEPADREPLSGIKVQTYDNRDALARLIRAERPDALIVGYWELIEDLPDLPSMPIILDVVAPRILEAMYQQQLDLTSEVRRTLLCYRRVDHFLVGNHRQASFLLGWLILAGFDCRERAPVSVLPISTEINDKATPNADSSLIRFVSGGVSWPWRQTEAWFDRLIATLSRDGNGRSELVLFSGTYLYANEAGVPALSPTEASWPGSLLKRSALRPYGQMQQFLRNHCHVGVELADENLERQFSQSFRAMEFLRNGLPLICNGYTELSTTIRDYDAGWVVDRIDELDGVIQDILENPQSIAVKSANALRLVTERLHYAKTVQPVLDFLQRPVKAFPGVPLVTLEFTEPAEQPREASLTPGLPVFRESSVAQEQFSSAVVAQHRQNGNYRSPGMFLRSVLKKAGRLVLCSLARIHRNDSVIIVSRSDIRPANHGAAVKIDRTAWGLSQSVKAVYLLSGDRSTYHEVRDGSFRERRFPRLLSRFGPTAEQIRESLSASGVPQSDAFLYAAIVDWSFILRTLYLALIKGARVYQAEFPGYARATVWARDLLGGRALLVEHNVEYQRLSEQTPDLAPNVLQWLKDVEIGLCRRSDRVITVSDADRDRLVADGVSADHIRVIPHGVDLDQFDQFEPLDLHAEFGIPPERAILVYHGIYLYPPNLEAMDVMAHEVLPRLERLGVKATVLAIGRNPPTISPHPDIIFPGPVVSVAPYLKAADLAVVPLQSGGGTRMKILDYFAAGIPVVSTTKGAEGIPIQSGIQAVIVDDYDGFARAVATQLRHPDAGRQMGNAGRAFVEHLDWRSIASRYLQLV